VIRFAFIFLSVYFLGTAVNAQRIKYNFNPGWKVFVGDNPEASKKEFNDADWKNVTLPYAWNEDDAFIKKISGISLQALPGIVSILKFRLLQRVRKYF
jgi:hypothetical protein